MSVKKKLRNITLSADPDMIAAARLRASQLDFSLNDAFRAWLEQFTRPVVSRAEYVALMKSMNLRLSAKKFSRDQANER